MVSAVNVRVFSVAAVAFASLVTFACGSDSDHGPSIHSLPDGGGTTFADAATPGSGCAPATSTEKPTASCDVTVQSFPIFGAQHVPEGTELTYCSNPPSSGNHYPVWANFQEYSTPVAWPYLVHSMEHGAVLLLFNCDDAGCADVVDVLRKVRDEAAADPICAAGTKRIIIAPSTTIPSKVAAASWGKTYVAPCADEASLAAFVRDNYGKGSETLCDPGRSF
jgi:hypothetical protein